MSKRPWTPPAVLRIEPGHPDHPRQTMPRWEPKLINGRYMATCPTA